MLRLFIALDLPPAVRTELRSLQSRLRGHPLRLVEPEGMHLTLQFLGPTEPVLVRPLIASLANLQREPLQLRLSGTGSFPAGNLPRVVWVGLAGDLPALARLQAAVVATTTALGCPAPQVSFHPHLTLARVRQGRDPAELRALLDTLGTLRPSALLAWEAGPPILFQSTLTPQGAIYTRPDLEES